MSSRRAVAAGRSCLECRRRKIKCDRAYPCSYCVKTRTNCTYPALRTTTNTEDNIAARLEIVESRMTAFESDLSEIKQLLRSIDTSVALHQGSTRNDVVPQPHQEHIQDGEDTALASKDTSINDIPASTCSPNNPGGEERNAINASSDISGKGKQPDVFLPDAQRICFLWRKYLEVVDPVLKVIHAPTIQKLVVGAIGGRTRLTIGESCLLFSIYYAAVVVTSAAECYKEIEEERHVLLERYQTGLKHFLSRSDFMETTDLDVLQAFVIYLTAGRYDANGPDVHGMTGLAVGRAIKLGLHRDGEVTGIPPFETEMRRRLWWQICTLDVQTAQDHKSDPCVLESSFNTKLPANISDVGLDSDMSKYPTSKYPTSQNERTEMLLSLVQFEINYFLRQIAFSENFGQENSYTILPYSGIRKAIDLFQDRIHKQYVTHCDPNIPLDFVTTNLSQLGIEKMRLIASKSSDGQRSDTDRVNVCIRISQIVHRMRAYEKGQKWLWLVESQLELDALIYLLTFLCEGTGGDHAESAWAVVNNLYDYWNRIPEYQFRCQWTRIRELRSRALVAHNLVPKQD